jgi:hypothetical protein
MCRDRKHLRLQPVRSYQSLKILPQADATANHHHAYTSHSIELLGHVPFDKFSFLF